MTEECFLSCSCVLAFLNVSCKLVLNVCDSSSSMPPKGGWVGKVAFTLRTFVLDSHGV